RGVLLEHLFESRHRLHFVLHHDLVEFTGHVCQNAMILEFPGGCDLLEWSSQLARLPWLGNETVTHDDHKVKVLLATNLIIHTGRLAGPATSERRGTQG